MPSHIKRALESPAANYANTKDAGANGHTADDQQEDADAGGGMDFDDDGGGVDGQDDEHELGGEGGGDEVMEDGEAHGTAEKGRGSGKEVKPELGHTNGAPAALAANGAAPAAAGHKAAHVAMEPEEAARPAQGWADMYGCGDGGQQDSPQEEETADLFPATAGDGGAAETPSGLDGLTVDKEGHMPFFFIDAYESMETRPGEVYLFGKVPIPDQGGRTTFVSSCAIVRNCYRSLLVVPSPEVFADADGTLAALEAKAKADPTCKLELLKALQERCSGMKAELREVLHRHNVRSYRMVPVKRSYAFEQPEIPHGEQWVVKVRYPATESTLPVGLSGRSFVAVMGAGQQGGSLEPLILKRGIKGPGWMLLKGAKRVEYQNQISWCKVEVGVDSPKSVLCDPNHQSLKSRSSPMLTTASLNLKTVVNPKTQQHEIVAASVVYLSNCVDIEAPMPSEKWNKHQVLRNFSVVRKLDGHAWPPGFEQAVAANNASARGKAHNGAMWMAQATERSLLTSLLAKLQHLDADVLVGHNISGFDLGVLLNRMQFHKVPLWSRIGRLKRNTYPKLTGGGHAYGGGAGPGTLSTVAGRLLCDTYLSARELVKEVDYTLRTLAQNLLGQAQMEMPPHQIPLCYESAEGLDRLIRHAESDAWLALGLMHHLAVLPLSKALSNLSGSLWSKTLQGARAQRIEMLLLHEFHARKFILPDKLSYKDKEKQSSKKEAAAAAAAMEEPDMMDCDEEAEEGASKPSKGGKKAGAAAAKEKGPQYAGGLVLEPKKGLYDKIVILLDFNSLYPSIIQEYNICFTTVQRPADGSLPPLPESPGPGTPQAPLAHILASLVQRRRQAKQAMANASNAQAKQQLNIRQQALKLTANSMYGCLGFTHSRFYARPLAELITAQGRSILQSTVDIVQGAIGAEVIYGDTDSIMIYTGSDDMKAAHELAGRIKREINKRYRLLEIELDGLFKCMLLLKKKKYASIKLERGPDGRMQEVPEQKGLDIVRRDWCPLSKDIGNMALRAILSGRPREEVVEEIHDNLGNVRQRLSEGLVSLDKFVITKQLTKRPEEYPDARAQPHVQVALRRRAAGKRDGIQPGETVPYIICIHNPTPSQENNEAPANGSPGEKAGPLSGASPNAAATPHASAPSPTPAAPTPVVKSGGSSGQLAERAYHPDEVRASGGQLMVDVEYYLANQVHPVVSRLCAPIEGTDPMRIADCLGLDSARFKGAAAASAAGESGSGFGDDGFNGGSIMDDDEHYKDCAPLTLLSPNGSRFEFRGAMELAMGSISVEQLFAPPDAVGDEAATIRREALVNQVLLRAREAIATYYDGELEADDELARAANNGASTLRDVVLKPSGEVGRFPHPDVSRHAGVLLSRRMSERKLFLQLSHFYRLLHPESAIKRAVARMRADNPRCKVEEAKKEAEARVKPAASSLLAAAEAVGSLRAQSSYNWVNLTELFGVLDSSKRKSDRLSL